MQAQFCFEAAVADSPWNRPTAA